jgi:hypothetical protein
MTTIPSLAFRFLALAAALLTGGCTPQFQCYLQRKAAIDSVYRPRFQQLQMQLAQGRISRATFSQRATALEDEWNRRLDAAERECSGTRRHAPSQKVRKEPSPPKSKPAENSGQDSPRVKFYQDGAKPVRPDDAPPVPAAAPPGPVDSPVGQP